LSENKLQISSFRYREEDSSVVPTAVDGAGHVVGEYVGPDASDVSWRRYTPDRS
jgi:hypothetical protein